MAILQQLSPRGSPVGYTQRLPLELKSPPPKMFYDATG